MADILPINTTLREVIEGEYVEQYFTAQLSTNETLKSINIIDYQPVSDISVSETYYKGNYNSVFTFGNDVLKYREGDELKSASAWEDLPNPKTADLYSIPDAFTGATFDEIKNQLINWLSGQKEFQDFDFAGSRLNVLLDLLAYNTLYIQQFSNTALYESFIGTANLRSSVVQAAQQNGYLPSSKSAATASIMLEVTHMNPSSTLRVVIPRGTKFLAYSKSDKANPYNFVVTENVVAIRDNDQKYWPIVNLNKLQESEQWLQSKIIDSINRYYVDEVEMFNKNFSKSKLLTYIDDTDHSIIGSSVDIQMVREIVNYFTLPSAGIKYYNTITPRTLRSGDLVFTVTPTAEPYSVPNFRRKRIHI